MSDPLPGSDIPRELSKDDLLKYIELDLWGKFQERLWKVVGVVLTLVTVVGLLGIPYYIKSEVSATLQKQAVDFRQRTDEILTHAKLLSIQSAWYEALRFRFDSDVYRLIDAIRKSREHETTEEMAKRRFSDPAEDLARLISRNDFAQVTQGSIMSQQLFSIPENLKGKRLLPGTAYIVENKGFSGAGGYVESHPVKDGTYEGSIRDLRFRIVVLEGLRRAMDASRAKLLALGGATATEIESRFETVRVKALESTDFNQNFSKELATLANQFLSQSERTEFARIQSLYVPDEVPKYRAPAASSQSQGDSRPVSSPLRKK